MISRSMVRNVGCLGVAVAMLSGCGGGGADSTAPALTASSQQPVQPPSSDVPSSPVKPVDPPASSPSAPESAVSSPSIPGEPSQPVLSAKERLLARIRAGMARAESANAMQSTPLLPPASWAPDQAYLPGDVVRGAGDQSPHQYIAILAGGRSAASGAGPTGAGMGPIQDGGVTWYYDREVRTRQASADAPEVSWGLRADLLKAVPGYQTITPTLNDPVVFFSGGVVQNDPNMPKPVVTVLGSNFSLSSTPRYQAPSSAAVTFWTNSSRVVMGSFNSIYARQRLVIEVNDRLLSDGQVSVPMGTSPINPGGFLLDFSKVPNKTAMKKVRVLSTDGFSISAYQFFIEPGTTLVSQPNADRWKLAVEGDSLTQGGYNSPYHAGLDWVTQAGRLLGCDDVANMAQGGTGFIADNGGKKTNYLQRVERLAALNADVYLIAGNHNDSSYPAQEQIDAALAYFKRLRELQPQALIVVAGTNPLQGESTVSGPIVDAERNLRKAFDAWADANAYFLPVTTDPDGPWITGSGAVDKPRGDGNMEQYYISVDGHPLQRGVNYFAQRYAQALKKLFQAE